MQFLDVNHTLDLSKLPKPANDAQDPPIRPAAAPAKASRPATRRAAAATTFTDEIITLLNPLLAPTKGRPISKGDDPAAVRRRVTRPGGYAAKTAALFNKILDAVNTTHNLGVAPLALNDVLSHMPAGQAILKELATSAEQRTLAEAARDLGTQAGRACKAGVLGVLASGNAQGQMSTARVAEIAGVSQRHVQMARAAAAAGTANTFTAQSKKQGVTRAGVGDVEQSATLAWMRKACPARSGDQRAILWMSKSKEDFFFEDYRSVDAQVAIYNHALAHSEQLRARVAGRKPASQWERNVAKYVGSYIVTYLGLLINVFARLIDARDKGVVDSLRVKVLWEERPLLDDRNVAAIVGLVPDDAPPEIVQEEVKVQPIADEEEVEDAAPQPQLVLNPRAYRTFYGTILAKERVWQRPPDDHCQRCSDFTTKTARHLELTRAVSVIEGEPTWDWAHAIVEAAGGSSAAHEEARQLALVLPDLKKHVTWRAKQRAYLKRRERALPPSHQLWQLDYGGLTDSCGRKVSVWSATVIRPQGAEQENIDFFFNSANQGGAGEGAAKKDGQTGIYFLRELFDPARSPPGPDGQRVSMARRMFPEVKHIVLSGDTGNGYRAYAMLDELSRLAEDAGITFELIPLAPGHAFNRSDARIAHQNTFLRGLKRRSRVFGARGVASAFHAASDPGTANPRKHLKRSHCFFREVYVDRAAADLLKKQLGAQLKRPDLDKGHMGVRGLLFFDFCHGAGYATVRQHGDPNMADNPSMIYTWRKDLSKLMCQRCSDRLLRPTLLTHAGCTKRRCAFQANPLPAPLRLPMAHDVQAVPQPVRAAAEPAAEPAAARAAVDDDDWLLEDGDASDAHEPLSPVGHDNHEEPQPEAEAEDNEEEEKLANPQEPSAVPAKALQAPAHAVPVAPSSSSAPPSSDGAPAGSSSAVDNTPPLTNRADWISWRVTRPFEFSGSSRETRHEMAIRAYDEAVMAAAGSGGRRRRQMPATVMTSCQGSREDLKRLLKETAPGSGGKNPKQRKRRRR
jgi:hypothetical protein